jgi:hypothetical protein
MAYNSVIRADDPKAVEQLKENLAGVESRQEYMQTVNDYYKENGTTVGCPGIDEETAVKLDERVNEQQATPYPGRFFKENYAQMNRLKSNIERLTNNKDSVFKCWQFKGGEAVINLANNRLQLMFNEKPSEEQRTALKQNGFKWAPNSKAWQRPLDFKSMSAADRIDFIKPLNGRNVSDLQPAPPKHSAPER